MIITMKIKKSINNKRGFHVQKYSMDLSLMKSQKNKEKTRLLIKILLKFFDKKNNI
jgi:hypothetical protein